jgi:cytochrome c6
MNSLMKLNSIPAVSVTIIAVAVMLSGPNAFSGAGEDQYKSKCAMCHASDGSGNTIMGKNLSARDLRSAEVQKKTDAQMTEIIAKGKGKMPPHDQKMSKEQISQVVAVIRELAKKH